MQNPFKKKNKKIRRKKNGKIRIKCLCSKLKKVRQLAYKLRRSGLYTLITIKYGKHFVNACRT